MPKQGNAIDSDYLHKPIPGPNTLTPAFQIRPSHIGHPENIHLSEIKLYQKLQQPHMRKHPTSYVFPCE